MTELFSFISDFFFHLDKNLPAFLDEYGGLIYLVLFIVIFCETGLVVTPFLPGDSLIFICGALAAEHSSLSLALLFLLLIIAAIGGDSMNYLIGSKVGAAIVARNSHLIKKDYIHKAERFYARHGRKSIFLARFVPIVRTFAPFVAGIGTMHYGAFITFNIAGGIVWVSFFLLTGYFFGNLPFVQENFTLFVFAIVFISMLPVPIEWYKDKKNGYKA